MGKCEILLEPREIMYGKSYVMNTGCDNCMWKFGWAMLGHLETMWSHVGTKLSHVLVVYVILASQSQNGILTIHLFSSNETNVWLKFVASEQFWCEVI